MRVGIIGAGITGLSIQHRLTELGIESTVLERTDSAGGVIRSKRVDGRVLDFGPQRTRLTPPVQAIVETLDLSDRVLRAHDGPLYVYFRDHLRRVPMSPRGALTSDLLSWRGKLRVLLEPLTAPPRSGETVRDYLARAFGTEFADRCAGPILGSLYGSSPSSMPVEHTLRPLLRKREITGSILLHIARRVVRGAASPPAISFDEGMAVLPRALAAHHADSITFDADVASIEATADGVSLETSTEPVAVDQVVITTPAPAAASMLGPIDEGSADALMELTYNPFVIVHLVADAPLEGAGFVVPFDEETPLLGSTWNDHLFDRDGVYTCYLGGAKRPDLVEAPDETVARLAASSFETITGVTATPITVHRITPGMPAFDRSWSALDRLELPDGIHLCSNYTGRPGIPGRIRAGRALAEELAGS